MRFFIGVSLSMLATVASIPAQAANIYVDVTANDPSGKLLAYNLRERIASSARNILVNDPDDAAFKISIVTLDPDSDGNRTIYSVVLNLKNYSEKPNFDFFVTSWVGVCGRTKIEICANSLASDVDAEMQPLVEAILKALKKSASKNNESSF